MSARRMGNKPFVWNPPELELTPAVWARACDLARKAREAGHTVPPTDILIVACARQHGVGIEHCDSHFDVLAALG
jgi:predicted nucleic acid-binding protein